MKGFSIDDPLDTQCKDTDDDGRFPRRDGELLGTDEDWQSAESLSSLADSFELPLLQVCDPNINNIHDK